MHGGGCFGEALECRQILLGRVSETPKVLAHR
jgi:hypothetical protein